MVSELEKNITKSNVLAKIFIISCGVILPMIALIVELATRMCASTFFDPIPTIGHIIMVASVPIFTIVTFLSSETRRFIDPVLGDWLIGFVIGVTFIYTLRFLPLTVLAVFGIMFMGIGLLALAPHLSLAAAICYRIKLKRAISPDQKRKNGVFWSGIIISILIIVALDLPVTFTRIGLQMTLSSSKATQIKGVEFLRTFGNKKFLLRSCYVRPGISDLFGIFFSPIEPEHSREIFYRVTGTPFNSVRRPSIRSVGLFENFDPDLGGDVVAGRINNLKLFSSRIDGSIDPEAALSYLEWTMVFKNHDQFYDHEARAKILLPPGAVVSRLTLWINNEEREAAFAGRGKVKTAYKKVVQRLRDPALVTTAGPNQILIQCFPVPRNQGEMKIRIGISAPMILDGWESALLKLPTFVEHNFSIPKETSHSIWIESKKSLEGNLANLSMEHPRADLFRVKGLISNTEWTSKPVVIRSNRVNNSNTAWTEDPLNPKKQFIIQKIVPYHLSKPKRIILVVDGSKSIEKYKSTIAALLPKLPSEVEFGALVASDEVIEIIKPVQASPEIYRSIGNRLKDNSYQGGQDNLPALIRALELTSGDSENAIIWIHGPQPILLSPIDNLLHYWDRLSEHPAFYDIQTETGPNLVLEKLPPIDKIYYVPRLDNFEKDLELLFTRWNRIHFSLVRQKHTNINLLNLLNPNQKTSSHLARLWCRDQVYRMISPADNQTKKAIELASSYHIVTPVTGAVVLENESQYKEGGLEPVEPGTVPTIPEPDIWFMIIIALFLIVLILVKSRRRRLCAAERF